MSESLSSQWLKKAAEDLVVARLVLPEDHTAHACFLAQQCIEKALKAYLLSKTSDYHASTNWLTCWVNARPTTQSLPGFSMTASL
jgi:HEPN domain-containing protein